MTEFARFGAILPFMKDSPGSRRQALQKLTATQINALDPTFGSIDASRVNGDRFHPGVRLYLTGADWNAAQHAPQSPPFVSQVEQAVTTWLFSRKGSR